MAINAAKIGKQYQAAFAALQAGRKGEARRISNKLIKIAPGHPDLAYLAGAVAHAEGKTDEAEAYFRKALAANPRHAAALSGIGFVLRDRGRFDEALQALEQARRAAPRDGAVLNAIGLTLHDLGRTGEAVAVLTQAIKLFPKNDVLYENLGEITNSMGHFSRSVQILQEGLRINPANADLEAKLLLARHNAEDDPKILEQFEELVQKNPQNWEIRRRFIEVLISEGKLEDALAQTEHVLARRPGWGSIWRQQANILKALGHHDEARRAFEEIVATSQDRPDAAPARISYSYAMAEAHEALGNYEVAFDALAEANRLVHQQMAISGFGYDHAAMERRVNEVEARAGTLRAVHEELRDEALNADIRPRPIFVVGMPRSGTTLLEQVLSRHPDIAASGELTSIQTYWDELEKDGGGAIDAIVAIAEEPGRTALRQLASRYVADAPGSVKRSAFMVDKMPGNIWALPLILSVFPDARIIHSRRNPMDTCLSNFQQEFSHVIRFSADLDDLALHYRAYRRYADLMAEIYGDAILQNDYEALTVDPEGQSRRLIAHIGVRWDDAVLDFNKKGGAVRTASRYQVRQGLYRSSVQKWKRYEAQLQPLYAQLRDFMAEYEEAPEGKPAP